MLRLTLALSLLAIPIVTAQQPATPPAALAASPAEKPADVPPLPADAHVAQSMVLAGKTLNYTATVGTLPVYNADGKKTGDVVYTSYTMDGANRPVTFALNGGPGASSVYLNLGAIGPKVSAVRRSTPTTRRRTSSIRCR